MLEDRPDAVYFPAHVEGMAMAGMGAAGDYRFGLMYSYPHRFWNVNGTESSLTEIASDDDVHLMATVWDAETRQVLPDTGLSLEIERDGDLVSQEVIYPMLSQPMGFHYGANFGLDGDGEAGVYAFGPRQAEARIETDKAYQRRFMREHDIPGCPAFETFDRWHRPPTPRRPPVHHRQFARLRPRWLMPDRRRGSP